jgi:hypothetical protein
MIPIISYIFGLKLERRILDKNFCEVDSFISPDNYYNHFITLLMNWCNNRLLPVIRQFFLMQNRINYLMDLGK